MIRRILAILLPILVLAVACSGSDSNGFDSDPGPIDPILAAALGEGVSVEAVPAVQRNFLELCVEGTASDPPELAALQQQGLVAVCGCTYDTLVLELRADAEGADAATREGNAYDAFRELEANMRADSDLDPMVEAISADCIRSEAGI